MAQAREACLRRRSCGREPTWFLERMVGRGRAVDLSMPGEHLSAEQAVQWAWMGNCATRRNGSVN